MSDVIAIRSICVKTKVRFLKRGPVYSKKFVLPVILICLNGSGSSQTTLPLADFAASYEPASNAQEASSSSAISSELPLIAAKGQLGDNRSFAGYRYQLRLLYESRNFAPLWLKTEEPTSQAGFLIEALRASRQKGLNPGD